MEDIIKNLLQEIERILAHLKKTLNELRSGSASVAQVENILVEVYGSEQPLKNIANIGASGLTITIDPWDKSCLSTVQSTLQKENIGQIAGNSGQIIINIPPITEEVKKRTLKEADNILEEAKVSIRNARHEARKKMDALNLPDSEKKSSEQLIENEIKKGNEKASTMTEERKSIIMKV